MKRTILLLLIASVLLLTACGGQENAGTTTQPTGGVTTEPTEGVTTVTTTDRQTTDGQPTVEGIPLSQCTVHAADVGSYDYLVAEELRAHLKEEQGISLSYGGNKRGLILRIDTNAALPANTGRVRTEDRTVWIEGNDRVGALAAVELFCNTVDAGSAAFGRGVTAAVHSADNLLYCLTDQRSLSVVFAGDSVCAGAGVDDKSTTYAARTSAWLRQTYPDAEIHWVNVGVGGTDTEYGLYHMAEYISRYAPDVVFLEYGSNDAACERTNEETLANYEGMIEQLRQANPRITVFLLPSLRRNSTVTVLDQNRGQSIGFREAMYAVARHYDGVYLLDWGWHFAHTIRAEEQSWNALTGNSDGTHPNAEGYRIITDYLTDTIAAMLDVSEAVTADYAMPDARLSPYSKRDVTALPLDGMQFDAEWGKDGGYMTTDTVGATASYRFTGSGVGVYWNIRGDGGDLSYLIENQDGETVAEGTVSACNSLTLNGYPTGRTMYRNFAQGLPYGDYTLYLQVAPTQYSYGEKQSSGHRIRLVSLLLNESR